MPQTTEQAQAVVVTAPKEKLITPITPSEVENIVKQNNPLVWVKEIVKGIEGLIYFKEAPELTMPIYIRNVETNQVFVVKLFIYKDAQNNFDVSYGIVTCYEHDDNDHTTKFDWLDSADINISSGVNYIGSGWFDGGTYELVYCKSFAHFQFEL